MRAAIIGSGVIGAGWASRFLLMGWDVSVFEPSEQARLTLKDTLDKAAKYLPTLYDTALPASGTIHICDSVAQAVVGADWIQESVSETLELKLSVLEQIQSHALLDAIIGSSTSGFRPSQLGANSQRPEQIIVAHPFNPVYLLPLVELVGDDTFTQKAAKILTTVGMKPLIIRREIDAHVADRLMEAAWREALWLVHDDVATAGEIDESIRYGFGLRWAQMGIFDTWRLAGGTGGIEHFLEQFGPALKWPWTKLTETPELTPELIAKIARQCESHSGEFSVQELEQIRDENLVSIIRSLKARSFGAGAAVAEHEKTLAVQPTFDAQGQMITSRRIVPIDWTDYNGHVNESRFCQAFSDAGDTILRYLGLDEAYLAGGHSWFTVTNHIEYLHEVKAGDSIVVKSIILQAEGKKLRMRHEMFGQNGEISAKAEQLLVHVNLSSRRSCAPLEAMAGRMRTLPISPA